MILYRVNRKFPFQMCPCIEMFDFTGVFVPFIVNLSLNGKLLLKIFVFVVWYTVVYRCSMILTLKLNNHTLIHSF